MAQAVAAVATSAAVAEVDDVYIYSTKRKRANGPLFFASVFLKRAHFKWREVGKMNGLASFQHAWWGV